MIPGFRRRRVSQADVFAYVDYLVQEEAYVTWGTPITKKEGYNIAVKIELFYLEERPAIAKCEESAPYRSAQLTTLVGNVCVQTFVLEGSRVYLVP